MEDLYYGIFSERSRNITDTRNRTWSRSWNAEPGFKYDDKTIIMDNGDIVVLKDGTKIEQISIETFIRKPREAMRMIAK